MSASEKPRRAKLTDEEILLRRKEQEAALRLEIKQRERAISEKKRKERTRALIEKGGLIEIAGLMGCDAPTLTGALLEVACTIKEDKAKAASWRQEGAYALTLTPEERKEKGLGW